jgi:hypothetical protein
MREIRTSGSMSGDGKRSVAAWPKLPRPSSTLPTRTCLAERERLLYGLNLTPPPGWPVPLVGHALLAGIRPRPEPRWRA